MVDRCERFIFTLITDQASDLPSQLRKQHGFEPRILVEPGIVAPGGMGQRDDARQAGALHQAAKVSHSLVHRTSGIGSEMPALRIETDQQDKLDLRQEREQTRPPMRRTLSPRRQVSAGCIQSREAEPHRDDGNAGFIVELVFRDTHPIPQTTTRWIGVWDARSMNPRSRRLSDDRKPRRRTDPQHWSRLMRQRLSKRRFDAKPTAPDFTNEPAERTRHAINSPYLPG